MGQFNQNDYLGVAIHFKVLLTLNARISGELRTGEAAALHRKTLYSTHSKKATRCGSFFNSLLCA